MACDSSERDLLLTRLADEFAERYRRGERPPLREYVDRYPELAQDIRELFPAMVEMEQAKDDREDLTPPDGVSLATLQRLGDFRILREIGRGGMGVVYEAEQISLGRHVALKVLPQKALLDRTQKQRFEREAKTAAKLHHTNIVPVFAVGEHDGLPYYAMQFIQGLGLDLVIEELQRLQAGGGAEKGTGPLNTKGPVPSSAAKSERRTARGDVSAAQVAQSLLTGGFAATLDLPATGDVGPVANLSADLELAGNVPRNSPAASARADTSLASSLATLNAPSVILPGQSGADPSSRSGKMTYWKSVAQVGIQVAEALAYAHDQGLLHRDIKPSNLLLDTHGTVWVTDFGLAKADDQQNLTQRGDIIGTLRYMPPEAFDAKNEPRSDIYSLGLTLYEMLALRPAFEASDRQQLIRQVTNESAAPLDRINRHIPRDLVTIVHKAMDREPAHRYATARDFAEDLRHFCADESIQARRPSRRERLLRWVRHHPGLAASLGVIALILIVATIGSGIAALRFQQLAKNEETARKNAEEVGAKERWERYRSNIAAASAALQLQNSGAARNALDDAPEEHRNWEWQYLHNQLDGAAFVLRVPGGKVRSQVLSPSGRQIAVCCWENPEVYLYDVATGKQSAVLRGHSDYVTSVMYRPDGKQLATASVDQSLRLWDPATGQPTALLKAEAVPGKWEGEPSMAYNADGSRIASFVSGVGGASTCRLWDAATGQEIAVLGEWQEGHRAVSLSTDGKRVAVAFKENVYLRDAVTGRQIAILGPHASLVRRLAFSPNGKRIASTALSDDFHLWDGETGKEVAVCRGHTGHVMGTQFSPDGARLISRAYYPDNAARVWDAATGRLLAVLAGHKNEIATFAFSRDNQRIVTASLDQTARLWDGRTGQLLAVLRGHTGSVRHVQFNPDGTRVVTAAEDATLQFWDAQTGELIGVLRGHGDAIGSTPVFTPDGSRLVSGSVDGTVRIWDMNLVERNGVLRGHQSFVYDVAFSGNGEQVASVAWDGTARVWDATTGRQTSLLKHETDIISAVAFSRDGCRLATMERGRGVMLWDVAAQKIVNTWRVAAGEGDTRIAFNSAETLVAAGAIEGPARVWDVATGREVARFEAHQGGPVDVAFHPDGNLLATTGGDMTIRLWDIAAGGPVAVLRGHTSGVSRAAFSADGKLLASSSNDKTIRLWDAQTHEPLAVIRPGSNVFGVAFSPDGTRLAAACHDNTIRLFDVATCQQVAELRGHTDYVYSVGWSPDGTQLVSSSGDFTVRVWDSLSVLERAKREADARRP